MAFGSVRKISAWLIGRPPYTGRELPALKRAGRFFVRLAFVSGIASGVNGIINPPGVKALTSECINGSCVLRIDVKNTRVTGINIGKTPVGFYGSSQTGAYTTFPFRFRKEGSYSIAIVTDRQTFTGDIEYKEGE